MKIHVVQKGETLQILATAYGVDLDRLVTTNKQIISPEMLMPGMKVKIPAVAIKPLKNKKLSERNDMDKSIIQKIISPKTMEKQRKVNTEPRLKEVQSLAENTPLEKKEGKAHPSKMQEELHDHHFFPNERLSIKIQDEKIGNLEKNVHDSPLHKRDKNHEQFVCCSHCSHPMKIDRPTYFLVQNAPTDEKNSPHPFIPTALSYAKPTNYLS